MNQTVQKSEAPKDASVANPPGRPPRKAAIATLRQHLEGDAFRLAIAKALPRHLTPDRFIRVACTAITRTPKLADCDQTSFFNALLTLSQLGLEPDGRRAHLIPFNNTKRDCVECQLIVDYKGLAELAMRSGVVSNIHADVVCENDDFDYDRGQLLKHRIDFRKPRGAVYAAYALCRFKDSSEKCEVLTRDEVESVRKRSRAGGNGPWVTDWNEMAKKTAFRRLSKWLPLSSEFRDAVEADSDPDTEVSVAPKVEGPNFLKTAAPAFELPQPDDANGNEELQPKEPPPASVAELQHRMSAPPKTPVDEFVDFLADAGVSSGDFLGWLESTGRMKDATSLESVEQVPIEILTGLRNDPKSLAKLVRLYGKPAEGATA